MPQETSKSQKWGVIAFAVLLVGLSVGTTLHLSGIRLDFWQSHHTDSESRYRHITLTDAEMVCTDRARKVFTQRLSNLRVDRFSSRLDQASAQFKVFMQADVYATAAQGDAPRHTFINCFTATHAPEIQLFQYAGDDAEFVAPEDEGRGMFGL